MYCLSGCDCFAWFFRCTWNGLLNRFFLNEILVKLENRCVVFFDDQQKGINLRVFNNLVEHFNKHSQKFVKSSLYFLAEHNLIEVLVGVQVLMIAEKEVLSTKNLYLDFVRRLFAALKGVINRDYFYENFHFQVFFFKNWLANLCLQLCFEDK